MKCGASNFRLQLPLIKAIIIQKQKIIHLKLKEQRDLTKTTTSQNVLLGTFIKFSCAIKLVLVKYELVYLKNKLYAYDSMKYFYLFHSYCFFIIYLSLYNYHGKEMAFKIQ